MLYLYIVLSVFCLKAKSKIYKKSIQYLFLVSEIQTVSMTIKRKATCSRVAWALLYLIVRQSRTSETNNKTVKVLTLFYFKILKIKPVIPHLLRYLHRAEAQCYNKGIHSLVDAVINTARQKRRILFQVQDDFRIFFLSFLPEI